MSEQPTLSEFNAAANQAVDRLGIAPEVSRLFSAVSRICDEVGCACIAQRYRGVSEAHKHPTAAQCPSCFSQSYPTLHLLVKLAPLTRALVAGGYYDLALTTTELALSFEPTLDLDMSRAYLLVVLGENDAAWRIYNAVFQRQGTLPAEAVERLDELAKCHPSEEDIAELYEKLKMCTCKLPQNSTSTGA